MQIIEHLRADRKNLVNEFLPFKNFCGNIITRLAYSVVGVTRGVEMYSSVKFDGFIRSTGKKKICRYTDKSYNFIDLGDYTEDFSELGKTVGEVFFTISDR